MSFFAFILSILSLSVFSQDLEVLCSKALLSEMQKQKLISTSSGVCVQSLNDLPQVTIGLGSSVYSSGVASGKSLGNEDEKIKVISEVLTEKSLSSMNFEIHGYADGENNTISSYTDKFLGSKTTFTKSDVRMRIKDAHTRSKILELLSEVDEKTPINPVRSPTSGASFKHEPGVDYVKNIDRVMSLINNYYLAFDRGVKTCLQLAQQSSETVERAVEKCEKKVNGHASPNSEVASSGHIHCDARRKAVLILNPGEKATSSTNPGLVQPNFRIPQEGESRRDMQVASTLDLFKKISTAGTDPQTAIEKLATNCSGNPLDGAAYEFNKQNLLRMHADITGLASKLSDTKLKDAVLKGNYGKVKEALLNAEEALQEGESTLEDPVQKLMKGLNYGLDKEAQMGRVSFQMASPKAGFEVRCKRVETPVELKVFEYNYQNLPVFDCHEYDVTNKKRGPTRFVVEDPKNRSKVFKLEYANGNTMKWRKSTDLTDWIYQDSKYPKASRDLSSTDVFNCLSAASAIEEKLENQNQTGAGGEVIDPHDLYPDASGNVKVSINPNSIPSHPRNKDDKNPDKGWMCDKCHSGLHVQTDEKKVSTVSKRSRDFIQIQGGTQSQAKAPVSNMGLTFGSMKNLGFRKITRESFGGKCPASKKVCDCLRNVSDYGGLDQVLVHSQTINLNKTLQGSVPMTESDLNNSCLYTPPVAHSCSVAPSGKGSEKLNPGLKSPSCLALERFMDKYPDRKTLRDNTYPKVEDYLATFQKVKLTPLLCKNAFPSEDDAKDCKWGTSGSGSSGSRVSGQ